MPLTYRKLETTDAKDFRCVRLECLRDFPENFGTLYEDEVNNPKLYLEQLIEQNNPNVIFFGAFSDNDLIGIAGFIRESRPKTRHHGSIVSMYVKPDFHGRKVGENLLRGLIKDVFALEGIEAANLAVVADNPSAIKLYERIGFETFGVQKNYFKHGDKYWDLKSMQLTREKYLSDQLL